MHFLVTGMDSQKDKGYGIHAEAFKNAAMHLINSKEYQSIFIPQKHIPIQFLLRHSIELYLKSMIISLHIFLELPGYDNPESIKIKVDQEKGKKLGESHWLDVLFLYWSKLINTHKGILERKTKANWDIHPELEDLIGYIVEYDRDGTYFRYPYGKKEKDKDREKYAIKDIVSDLQGIVSEEKPFFVTLIKNENDEITKAYHYDTNTLNDVENALITVAGILDGYHAMTRHTFFDGY